MINHFPNVQDARAHLVSKGFNAVTSNRLSFVSRDGAIAATIHADPHRGPYVYFREIDVTR